VRNMPLKVTLLIDLKKLVDKEKLGEAEKAVFNAFMDMGTTVYKDTENMECIVVSGNNIISLTIHNTEIMYVAGVDKTKVLRNHGVAKIEVLHNHTCRGYNTTLQGVLDDVMDTIATALNIDKDKVADAIDSVITNH
jgi:hypothetical protein